MNQQGSGCTHREDDERRLEELKKRAPLSPADTLTQYRKVADIHMKLWDRYQREKENKKKPLAPLPWDNASFFKNKE